MTEGSNISGQEFDRHAAEYESTLDRCLGVSGYDAGYFDEYKVRMMAASSARFVQHSAGLRILNFGCGIGKCEPVIARFFSGSSIWATDVSAESIRLARERNQSIPGLTYAVADGNGIPFDESFDLIYCAGVLHHIPAVKRLSVLTAIRNWLAPGGSLFLFDHNPWNPVTRRIVESCPLDENAELLTMPDCRRLLTAAGFTRITGRFIVFFPRSFRLLHQLEPLLGLVPLGAQYCMTASCNAK